jgi:hypothetical protein
MRTARNLDDLRLRLAGGLLTPDDCRSLSSDEVLDLKSSVRYRSTLGVVDEKASRSSERTVVFDGSTEHRDRMGDVVRVHGRKGGKGWQVGRYLDAGAPFLWAHDASAPPVGQATRVWRGKSSRDPAIPALKFRVSFHESREYPFAGVVGGLFLSGKMKGSSVGFVVAKAERYASQKEREKAGLGPNGIEVTEADLLELSGTPTPANPFALATAEKSLEGGIERAIDDALEGLVADRVLSRAQVREFRRAYPLGPVDAADRLRARVRGFVDFGGLERVKPDGLKTGEFASWDSSGGRARGRVERIERDGEIAVPETDFRITGTPEDPAALLRVYDDDGRPTDVLVGHKLSTLTKIDPIEADEDEKAATATAGIEAIFRGLETDDEEEERADEPEALEDEEMDPDAGKESPDEFEGPEGEEEAKPGHYGDDEEDDEASKAEDSDGEEDEEEEAPLEVPMKSADGGLVIPKAYVSRIRDAAEVVASLAADLDDVLDVLEAAENRPGEPMDEEEEARGGDDKPKNEDEKSLGGCVADLLSVTRGLVEELRASRVAPSSAAIGGAVAPETGAERPTPRADGEARSVDAGDLKVDPESVDRLLRDVRSAASLDLNER